jgi:hypothetical protein
MIAKIAEEMLGYEEEKIYVIGYAYSSLLF